MNIKEAPEAFKKVEKGLLCTEAGGGAGGLIANILLTSPVDINREEYSGLLVAGR